MPGEDAILGGGFVPSLPEGSCSDQMIDAWTGVPEDGEWTLAAFVDELDQEPELIESNNSYIGPLTGVGFGPDLVIVGLAGPASTQNGASFDAEVEVCNQGTGPGNATGVSIYLSKDKNIDGSTPFPPGDDPFLGSLWVPSLAAGQCATSSGPVWASVFEEGAFHLGGIVDEIDAELELVESNNAFSGALIGVGMSPDLVLTRVEGPPSVQNGETFEAQVEVCNRGTQSSGPTDVTLYLSSDTQLGGSVPPQGGVDPFLNNVPVPPLDAGECLVQEGSAWVSVPEEGAWYRAASSTSSSSSRS